MAPKRAAGESATEGLTRRSPAPRFRRARAPGGEGARQVANRRCGARMAGLRGVAEEAARGRAGIPGLVSPRFPGAGSPWSLRGVMGPRLRQEGPPRAAARAPETHLRGSARSLSPGDRLGGAGWGGGGGVPGVGGNGGRTGGELGLLQEGRRTQWREELGTRAGVAGELRTFRPLRCSGRSLGFRHWGWLLGKQVSFNSRVTKTKLTNAWC